jgi:serine/threonine protein kinase
MTFTTDKVLNGKYHLVQPLGTVHEPRQTWLATNKETGETVTLKALSFDQQMAWQDLKLIEREAETLKSLKHEQIPSFVDAFWVDEEAQNKFCLVCKYIPGKSLAEIINSGYRWSTDEVLGIARSVLQILEYLHTQSPPVIHRDIKPSNIILGEDGKVYLIDFGAVQGRTNSQSTMTIVGSFGYMAPEQFAGKSVPATDFYSLGQTVVFLLSGVDPSDRCIDASLRSWEQDFYHLSPSLIQWLETMMHSIAIKRYPNASKALQELNMVMKGNETKIVLTNGTSKVSIARTNEERELSFPFKEIAIAAALAAAPIGLGVYFLSNFIPLKRLPNIETLVNFLNPFIMLGFAGYLGVSLLSIINGERWGKFAMNALGLFILLLVLSQLHQLL